MTVHFIRDANERDLGYLQDIDIKCFDASWTPDVWTYALQNYAVKVATMFGTPVGFVAFVIDPDDKSTCILIKLAVKKPHRGQGIGRGLFNTALSFCRLMRVKNLVCNLPESMCDPSTQFDCSAWLNKMGMRATSIDRDKYTYLGQVEDGFVFQTEVSPY